MNNTDDARNNTHIWCTGDTMRSFDLQWVCASMCLVCAYLHTGQTHLMCVPMHLTCECVCRRRVTQEFKGPLTKTGLAALKTATGMWGSTSLLWQCTHKDTHAHFIVAHSLFTFSVYYSLLILLHASSPSVLSTFSLLFLSWSCRELHMYSDTLKNAFHFASCTTKIWKK